jgi:predicted DNA-binding protein YlxM (UPF0122 family)
MKIDKKKLPYGTITKMAKNFSVSRSTIYDRIEADHLETLDYLSILLTKSTSDNVSKEAARKKVTNALSALGEI